MLVWFRHMVSVFVLSRRQGENWTELAQAALLPEAQAKAASKTAEEGAKKNRSFTDKSIDAETMTAKIECNKLTGNERKACMKNVAEQRQDSVDWAGRLI